MQLAPDDLKPLDLAHAISAAVPARGEFFPSRVEASAALHDPARLGRYLEALLQEGIVLGPPEVVWVPRRNIGSRPVPDAPFLTRVVMTALSERLVDHLTPLQGALAVRSLNTQEEGARRRFEQQILDDPRAEWVVLSDVGSFYEYVDHETLRREILEWTGDVSLADATRELLAELMGRQFGLPQGPRASDVLADLYLNFVDRRLARLGLTAYRFNDDFMLPVSSRNAGEQALAVLDRTLRERGLALNHAKGRLVDRGTFAEWVGALQARLDAAALVAAGGEFYEFDPESFAGVELREGDAELVREVFYQVLEPAEDGDPYFVHDRLLQKALPVLAKSQEPHVLDHLPELISDWAVHSRAISLYLRSLVGSEFEASMIAAVTPQVMRTDIAPWVRGWLLDPLARCEGKLSASLLGGLATSLSNPAEPWFVRGRAAIALAQRGGLPDEATMGAIFDLAPPQAQADLLAAVLQQQPNWGERARAAWVGASPLLRSVVEVFDATSGSRSEIL